MELALKYLGVSRNSLVEGTSVNGTSSLLLQFVGRPGSFLRPEGYGRTAASPNVSQNPNNATSDIQSAKGSVSSMRNFGEA